MGGEVIFDRSNKGGTIALGSNEIAHEDPRDGGGNCFNLVDVLLIGCKGYTRRFYSESTNLVGIGNNLILFRSSRLSFRHIDEWTRGRRGI